MNIWDGIIITLIILMNVCFFKAWQQARRAAERHRRERREWDEARRGRTESSE